MSRLRLALDLLATEGLGSVARRLLDRADERRCRLAYPARPGRRPEAPIPIVHLLATPPSPRLGGVQTQLVARREREIAAGRPFALLYPFAGRYRLEVDSAAGRAAIDLGAAPAGLPERAEELEPEAFARSARTALEACRAKSVRVEGAAGWPLGGLRDLAAEVPTTLAIHDFSLFCPRPHLVEEPVGLFCRYSRDPKRCVVCLRRSWPVELGFQERRRELANGLLAAAESVVFPSEFLRRTYRELFPHPDAFRWQVEPPLLLARVPAGDRPIGHSGLTRRIAYVGAAKRFKGAEVFAEVVERLAPRHPEISWHAFGGGDPDLLRRFRRLGVRVHGYYRAGTLPRLLARHRIDQALLLSIVPESYGLTLDECALAGVPALVFDHGAPAERAPQGGGSVVPAAAGSAGVAGRIVEVAAAGRPAGPAW